MHAKIVTNNLGAISALKGYRAQFLYSLLRILSYKEFEAEFRPEGKFEDLDIYNQKGEIIEIIQIKNKSRTLTFAEILTNRERNSFLRRALDAFSTNQTLKIKLVSFGSINEDIRNLGQKVYSQNLVKKLKKHQLSDNEINILQNHFDYEIVDEQKIEENIVLSLEQWGQFANTKITLDLLLYWIYYAAEKQHKIIPAGFKEQFDYICKFQNERISFYKTYHSLIRTLDNDLGTENIESLKSGFYKGISATYKHILANVDVLRIEKIQSIKEQFDESNILFIHGASGQGKSTLAYRYLNEYCSGATVFELKHLPEDITIIYEVINALEGISKSIRFPITIYIDVEPGYKEWINVLMELASKKNFRFLVTIREEDWNSIEVGDKFSFAEVEILFEKEEAELIYRSLDDYNKDLRFIDFEDAWGTFGGSGPLLEFVYLITQNESLSVKLKSQIDKIRRDVSGNGNEKIKLLRYVVLSDCFGSKIKLKDFSRFLQLRSDILFLIDLLQKEYLITISGDNTYISGLHPVRSEIIKKLLFDKEINVEADYVLNAIQFINDNTILNFLRNAFRRSNLLPNNLLERLKSFNIQKWQTYLLIFRSLLWKGIDDYLNKNIGVLNQVYEDYNKGWIIVVDFNFTTAIDYKSIMQYSDLFSKEQREYAKLINEKFSDKKEIFSYCVNWLQEIKQIDLIPQNKDGWDAFALFLFWLQYLHITDVKIDFEKFGFSEKLPEQPIDVLAHVLYAVRTFNEKSSLYTKEIEDIFLQNLCRTFGVIIIEQSNDSIDCNYLFDIIDEEAEKDESDFIHAKSMKIIDLLRFAFPDKEYYGAKGIGHHFSFLPADHDSSIKKIPIRNLPLNPLVDINSTYLNLFDYTKRPESWKEYIEIVIHRRQLFVEVLEKMITAFSLSHRLKNLRPLAEYVIDYRENYDQVIRKKITPSFPKLIIDEWGMYGEGSDKKRKSYFDSIEEINDINEISNKRNKQALAVKKYESYKGLYKDFDIAIENFLSQSADSILRKIKIVLKEDVSNILDKARISLVGNLFKAYEIIGEFQKAFKVHFEKFVDTELLRKLEKDEKENISIVCFLYRHFINYDTFLTGNISKIAINNLKEIEFSFKRRVLRSLKKLSKQRDYQIRVEFEETDKRCVIITDSNDALKSLASLELIYNSLFEIVEKDYTSIKYLIISSKYPVFNIIQLLSGKTINNKWCEFKLYNLTSKRFEELEQFNLLPNDIPRNISERYNLESWNNTLSEFSNLDKLLESTATIYQLAFHFSQLEYFENKEINEYNKEILNNHLEKVTLLFQSNFQTALELLGAYAELYNDEKIVFNDEIEKQEFGQILINSHEYFYPNEELLKKGDLKFSLKMKEINEWIPRLEKLLNNIAIVYYFLAGKIVEGKLENSEIVDE